MASKLLHFTSAASVAAILFLSACSERENSGSTGAVVDDWTAHSAADQGASEPDANGFVWQTEQFADLKIVRYQIPGWEKVNNAPKGTRLLSESSRA